MCAILDANTSGEVLSANPPADAEMFRSWVETGSGSLVAGGKLLRELENNRSVQKWLVNLKAAGKLFRINDGLVDAEEEKLALPGVCVSDDPHVVALAVTSGARLLFSRDNDLRSDFRNPSLVNKPRGKIFQGQTHLLRTNVCKNCK
ncbi:MAG: hypothetical protein AABY95_00165 [Pseudomonadota bacterium]